MHHRIERIHGRHHQQFHRLALALGDGHYMAEELALVLAEDLLLGQVVLGGAGGDGAHRHHHNVVPAQVRLEQDLLEMVHGAIVADGHQNAARAGVNRRRIDLRLVVEIEFFERFLVAMFALVDELGNREQEEEHHHERDAVDGGQLLGEQVGDGGGAEDQCRQAEADRDFALAEADVQRELVLLVMPLEAQRQHAEGLEEEAPYHAEGVRFTERDDITPGCR